MANTPTTPALVASRLTDEEIKRIANYCEERAYDFGFDTLAHCDEKRKAAVLRDYVRLRNLANAVKEKVNYAFYHGDTYTTQDAITELHHLLAEVEKGEKK